MAADRNPAVPRRTVVRWEYNLFCCILQSVLIFSGSTKLVRVLHHSPLLFLFSPATAASAASSPRIFEAAMNLNVRTVCQPNVITCIHRQCQDNLAESSSFVYTLMPLTHSTLVCPSFILQGRRTADSRSTPPCA